MHKATEKERQGFIFQLGKHLNKPNDGVWIDPDVEAFARRIMHRSATIGRLAEEECNRELSPDEIMKHVRKQELIEEDCKAWGDVYRVTRDGQVLYVGWGDGESISDYLCCTWLLKHQSSSIDHATKHEGYKIECVPVVTPVFSGDPRGATVKLKLATGYADDWGKVGLCVPTS